MEIDVSGCKYWQMAHCPEGYTCKYNCCDCYYKQLQQLKAENEGLQSLNDFNVQKIETLEAENEELRMLNKANADNYVRWRNKIEAENEDLKEKIKTYANVNEEDTKEWLKYKQCLDEIEGIIKDGDICCNDCKRLALNIIKQAKEGGNENNNNNDNKLANIRLYNVFKWSK